MDSKYFISGKSTITVPSKRKIKLNDLTDQKCLYLQTKQLSGCSIEEERKKLPVFNCRDRILKELETNDTLLIMGETGSGKTTQIPQFLLYSAHARNGVIAVTQPRRVAAITIAKRVAQELSTTVGDIVGYTVRFEDMTSHKTRIRFLTDGVLLREAICDRLLRKYSIIMLDEAHERTVNTDVLLGIVKEAQHKRCIQKLPGLKLIITSATMDIDHFGKYLNVRGMYLEGRTHSVRVLNTKEHQADYMHAVLVTVFEVHRTTPINHDILIFLTGKEEIEVLAQQIRQLAKINSVGSSDVRVFTLYSQLAQGKQLECFLPVPLNTRKIVIATNIAETSITIPGIRCVIDCGFVKEKSYSPTSGLDILQTVRISKAQAWQRSGRAGRDAPGTCYRTYTKEEMLSFENSAEPEILRANLTSTTLQLLALGINIQDFNLLDSPNVKCISNAYTTLENLGAIKSAKLPNITSLGRLMSQFPLDPKYSKLLLSAPTFGCMEEMLSLVAVLSTENIYVNPPDKMELATLAHAKFKSKYGDHLTLLNIYKCFEKTEKTKLWCHDNFLNIRNLIYARNVRCQLLEISTKLGLSFNSCGENLDSVRKCLITGLFGNIAVLQKDEMVLTGRNFLRQVVEINSEWVEDVVPFIKDLSYINIEK
ncbi:ATP-dependent RNA helicase DHX33 isoform X2 [Scaptodrosophila lebanonensis]|uniref:RNA helicase n=1 Tax=Drosophila lebanonensis TaxID=7225 RepID=A0A6J2U2T1_DROLE|nr:ATP-dependent RNA helicase DHX33 isoform X2 [Scaptodrosophila lebanonensis]